MAVKVGLIIAGIAGAATLGTGGYLANEWRVCRSLHHDYVTFAKATLADQQLKSAVNKPEFDEFIKRQQDSRVMRAGQTLFDLKERCGETSMIDAQLEAQEAIFR